MTKATADDVVTRAVRTCIEADPGLGVLWEDERPSCLAKGDIDRLRTALDGKATNDEWRRAEQLLLELRGKMDRLHERGVRAKDCQLIAGLGPALVETEALRRVRDFSASSERMLVLAGPVGVGKTVALSSAFAAERPRQQVLVTAAGLTRVDRFDEKAMAKLLGCAVLGIDDLGAEYVDKSGFMNALIDEIVNERYARRLRTLMTTNLNATAFVGRYGARVLDRIREVGSFVEMQGVSLRGRGAGK